MLKKSEEQTTNDNISLAYMKFAFIDSNNKHHTKGGAKLVLGSNLKGLGFKKRLCILCLLIRWIRGSKLFDLEKLGTKLHAQKKKQET
jgi:hypothetical protein